MIASFAQNRPVELTAIVKRSQTVTTAELNVIIDARDEQTSAPHNRSPMVPEPIQDRFRPILRFSRVTCEALCQGTSRRRIIDVFLPPKPSTT